MKILKSLKKIQLFYAAAMILVFWALGVAVPVLADSSGPAFVNFFPTDGSQISSSKPTISLTATDSDNVDARTVVMKIDGQLISPIKEFGWLDEYSDDYTTLNVYHPSNLTEGQHSVFISAKDWLGNTSERTWTFSVSTSPQISSLQPADKSTVADRKQVISAVITDNSGINQDSVVMTVNGTPVPAIFDQSTGRVSYQPLEGLNNETSYNIVLKVAGLSGSLTQAQWSFTVNDFGEMPFTIDDSTCQSCHTRKDHPVSNCAKCHGTNLNTLKPDYPLDDCYKCHTGASTYPSSYHAGGLPYSEKPDHPVQTIDSCVQCHTKTWPAANVPYYHDVTRTGELHQTSTTGCENCHSKSLTREHQTRADSLGKTMTCGTCHQSTNNRVIGAVKAQDSSCTACHDLGVSGSGHPAHNNALDASCQTCHSNSLLSEPQFHKQAGCNICHGSTAKDIAKYSINTKNTSCFSCHDQGHNVNLVQKIPDDIVRYPGFKWSVPQEAALWAGEPWVKQDYNSVGAKLTMSNRLQVSSGQEVYSWYEQLMAAQGWLKTEVTGPSGEGFTVTFKKGTRMATIIFYGGETPGQPSPFIGFRLGILFK